jgi:hypothetical protein
MAELRQRLEAPSWQWQRRAVERFVREVRVSVSPEGKAAVQAVYAFDKPANDAIGLLTTS